jgi:putative hemolysin
MIHLAVVGTCFLGFLVFELFAHALDRLSPIKLRGLLEEHPARYRLLAGKGEAEVMRTAIKVVVQIFLLAGFWSLTRAIGSFDVRGALLWSGAVFLLGWLLMEGLLLRFVAARPPEALLDRLLPLLSGLAWIVKPLALPIRVFFRAQPDDEGPASEEEIQAYIDVGREEGILEKEEEKLLLSIVDFGETTVKEVMTPRTDIVAVGEEASLENVADVLIESKYSRLPVYRGTIEKITGIVHVKDVFEAIRHGVRRPLSDLARPVQFVPETKRTAELLRDFQRTKVSIAIAVDEYGSVTGLVSMEDILEEIVGEISDEHEDERETVLALEGGAYSISARSHVDVLRELFERGPEEDDFDTVGGYLAARLGRIPRTGEKFEEDGLRLTVEEGDRRRVLRVRVEPVEAEKPRA